MSHTSEPGRLRCERGQAAMEFVLVMPLLLVFLVGVLEFGHAYETVQAMTGLSREGANLAARGTSLDGAVEVTLSNGADVRLASRGGVVASQVLRRDGSVVVAEQAASAGYLGRSRIGRAGEVAAGLGGIALTDGQVVHVVEVFYRYEPITPVEALASVVLPEELYERAVF